MRAWLLVPDPAVRPRDRAILAILRVVLAVPLVVAPVLLVLPFLTDDSARTGAVGDVGIAALIVLFGVLPLWLRPYALWQTGTLHVDDDVLTAYTVRDRRVLDLGHVRRVAVWCPTVHGVWAKLSGDRVPPVWVNWSDVGSSTSDRVKALVRDVAIRDGVSTNPATREVLELPDAPRGWSRQAWWLRDVAGLVGYGLLMAAVIVAYVNVQFGQAPWARP